MNDFTRKWLMLRFWQKDDQGCYEEILAIYGSEYAEKMKNIFLEECLKTTRKKEVKHNWKKEGF